jgi:hypothetical protein
MKVIVNCGDVKMEIPCGSGKQHMRWLALVTATRMQQERYPHAFHVPQRVLNSDGTTLKPRAVIGDVLKDGDEVTVELRQGAYVPEHDDEGGEWIEEAYGQHSNLMECKFHWKVDKTDKSQTDIPKKVRGEFTVAREWQSVYPQKRYGGHFELDIEAEGDTDSANFDWVASRKGPPGSCTYKFILENDTEVACKASPETLTPNGTQHRCDFTWDVPIAPEPYPEVDSRPSTASSRDGAQVDPRFEQDWEAMRLKWVENFMKVRVKDVLTEFYAILIDLFDSYAFMGLDLSASQHTIGMDDWKHLVINCGMLQGQPEGNLPWGELGAWFEEAAGVRDGRPYLAQRLTRAHYLELLMRTAGWVMCEHPRPQYMPEPGRPPMPLDEGLFRFITDILIPVMDVYDDDPIRKDAVQQQNLVVIQQNRPSIRSIYAFLAQPWPYCDNEKVVVPAAFRFVFEFTLEKLDELELGAETGAPGGAAEGGEGDAAAKAAAGPGFAVLTGEGKLTKNQVDTVLIAFDQAVEKLTANHPEPLEQRALLFWEFFEVVMSCCRELAAHPAMGLALHEAISAFVLTVLAFMGLVDHGEVQLPEPAVASVAVEGAAGFGDGEA